MSDEKDADPSDWLAKQFRDTGEVEPPTGEVPPTPDAALPGIPGPALREPQGPEVPPAKPFDWGFGAPAPSEPVAEETPVPEERPVPEETPVAEETPVPEETPVAEEPPVAEETPVPEALEGRHDIPTQAWPIVPEPVIAEPVAPNPAEVPTQAFTWTPEPEPDPAPDPAATVAIPAAQLPDAVAQPATERIDATDPNTPIDSLFGESSFQDYDESLLAGVPATVLPKRGGPRPPRGAGGPLPRNQRILIIVAGALVGVLLLVVLFFLGTRLHSAFAAAPTPTPTATKKTPTPTPTPAPTGMAAPGIHKWSDLRGGECIAPFTTVWAETFTVVDCATPHQAQMVHRGTFPATAAAASTATPAPTGTPSSYPGVPALQAQINLLCTAPGVIDLSVAGGYTDIQFQGAYAASAKEWDAGQHDYFCFVTRSSGQPLTNSVAGTPAA